MHSLLYCRYYSVYFVFFLSFLFPLASIANYVTCPSTCEQCPGFGAPMAYNEASDMYFCTNDVGCNCNPAYTLKPPPAGYSCPQYCSDCFNSSNYHSVGGSVKGTQFYICDNKETGVSADGQQHCSCIPPPLVRDIRPGFTPGAGGVHVVQYQRHETAPGENPTGDYEVDVRIYDGKRPVQNLIGQVYKAMAQNGKAVMVTSNLPFVLEVTCFGDDGDGVRFDYADQHWWSNGTECSVDHRKNGYENGQRGIDCGFRV